jgi:hypothetical protein
MSFFQATLQPQLDWAGGPRFAASLMSMQPSQSLPEILALPPATTGFDAAAPSLAPSVLNAPLGVPPLSSLPNFPVSADPLQRLLELFHNISVSSSNVDSRMSDTGTGNNPDPLLKLTGRPSRDECIERCWHILERPLSAGNVENYWAFQRCINRCMGRE